MSMYRILEHQMQMVRDYLYDIGENHMDDSTVVSLLRQELMEYGIYDGDSLKWKSKDNKYVFEIERQYNQLWTDGSQYLISITIKDGVIGNPITELRFNEFDAIRILYAIAVFPEEYFQTYDSCPIYVNYNSAEGHIITLENIFGVDNYGCSGIDIVPPSQVYDIEKSKDVAFTISYYSSMNESMANLVYMELTHEELADLAFHIFFECLIDIDLPNQCELELEEIERFILFADNKMVNNSHVVQRIQSRIQHTNDVLSKNMQNQYVSTGIPEKTHQRRNIVFDTRKKV